MPGRRDAGPIDATLCRRCQIEPSSIIGRNEPLCTSCFTRYISTKVVKRMESFRVRNLEPGQHRALLLPLSLGPASVSLLYLLSQHLKGQSEKTGRTGFELHVVHVYEDVELKDKYDTLLDKVKLRFPQHIYSAVPLSDALSLKEVAALIQRSNETENSAATEQDKLHRHLNSLDSATSRADMLEILKRRLITSFAQTHNCEAILWGDSTTRLAERTLAETAKGRGFSLPWMIADGETQSDIPSYRPMRDLLGKEIAAFASMVDPPLNEMIFSEQVKPAINLKNTTIDDLMRQYFESAEQEYPSIVTNVVRTTGKLQTTSLAEIESRCELCEMPLSGHAPERSRLCYGCIRTLPTKVS